MSVIQRPVSSIQKMRKRREKQLVIHCARTHMDKEQIRAVRRLLEDGDLDWDYILGNSSFYRISPLLLRNLKEIAHENAVPQTVMDTLTARYALTFYQNMRIYERLRGILERLQTEGIEVILLKGVALAQTIYADMALRPMTDIDLLVRKADLQTAVEIVSALGYTPPRMPESILKKHRQLPLRADLDAEQLEPAIAVDIHDNIVPESLASRINPDRLWEGVQSVNISGCNAFILSPENSILHLCIHLSKHDFLGGLRNLVDISEAIRYYCDDLDWHFIVRKSNECGMSAFVYYPLYLAREMMDADIPVYPLRSLKLDPRPGVFEDGFLKRMVARNVFRTRGSPFPQNLVTFISTLLCAELLQTSGIGHRASNIASKGTDIILRKYIWKNHV